MVRMFLREFCVVAARGRTDGGSETYSRRGPPSIGGRAMHRLLDARPHSSVASMRTSRACVRAMSVTALGIALVAACADVARSHATGQGVAAPGRGAMLDCNV